MAGRVASIWAEIGLKTDKLTAGLNQAKSGLSKFGADVNKQLSGIKKLGSGINDTVTQLTGFNIAQLGVAGAVGLAAKAIGDSIKFTQQYAEQVRTLSAATGMSNEETSKMIQLFDDAGVSAEQITAASRGMIQQGLAPSIDTIAKLADEFNAMNDPAAKGKLLLDNFGRAGLQMGKLLEMGSDAIRESGEQAERFGQVLDDEAIASAEEYRKSLDDLSDAAEGLKLKIGKGLVPVLADLTNELNRVVDESLTMDEVTRQLDRAQQMGLITGEEVKQLYADLAVNGGNFYDIQQKLLEIGPDINDQRKEMALAAQYQSDAEQILIDTEEDLKAAAENTKDVYRLAEDALRDSNIPLDEKVRLTKELKLASGELTPAQVEMERQVNIVTLAFEAGALKEDEYKKALDNITNGIPYAVGESGKLEHGYNNVETAADKAREKIDLMKSAIDNLRSKTITVTVNWKNFTMPQSVGGHVVSGTRAVGGPVLPGGAYVVGERGPEIFVPNTSGQIIPNNRLTSGGEGGNSFGDINIFIEGGDPEATAYAVMASFEEATRAAANSGISFAG